MRNSIRYGAITRILGRLVLIEALLMTVPLGVCLLYGEGDWKAFAVAVVAAGVAGGVAELSCRHTSTAIRGREGFIITALVWVVFGLFGMIPFMLCRTPLGFTDAMFEVISGFTTTGASMITDVEACSKGILFWRAFTQWIGGLGIILFMLALLPELNKAAGMSMFNAEATGITHGKLHPRIRQTALALWGVYCVITVVSVLLLWIGPMDLFDSICQTFAAIATGGFSTRNDGVTWWGSDYVLVVLTVVMFVAGLNFMILYAVGRGDRQQLWRSDVSRAFAATVVGAWLVYVVSALVSGAPATARRLVIYPLFHVVSAITSTGFSIAEVEGWGPASLFVTLLLMLCGACCGSTSGGIKIDRLMVLGRNFSNETTRTVFPKRTYVVSLNGSALQNSLVSRVSAYVSIYMLTVIVSTGIITMWGYSVTDSFFMVSSCIGCNGLGYGVTRAGGSFAALPAAVKWLLTVDMLAGRLELFSLLVLLLPSFWRR